MITELTPEQEARFPEFIKCGLDIGLSTERTDLTAAAFLRDRWLNRD